LEDLDAANQQFKARLPGAPNAGAPGAPTLPTIERLNDGELGCVHCSERVDDVDKSTSIAGRAAH
jgi:hypothetical protein